MNSKSTLTALTLMVAMTASASAATISVNFNQSTGGAAPLGSSVSAGVVTADNWNNISSDSQSGTSTGSALNDDGGNATAASVEVFNAFWRDGVDSSTGDHQMFSDYTNTTSAANGVINVTGLGTNFTSNGYDVYVYLGGTDSMGVNTPAEFGAGIGGDQQWIRSIRRTPGFNGSWSSTTFGTEAAAQSSSTESNYILFQGLNAANFAIDILKDPDSTQAWSRAGVRGIQIVEVPEPSSAALLGLSALGLALRRRR